MHMQRLAHGRRGGQSLRVRLTVEGIVRDVTGRDIVSLASALYDWFCARYTFLADPIDVELIRDPESVLDDIETKGRFVGDCDDAATFLAGALRSIGLSPVFVRVGFVPPLAGQKRGKYTHVFTAVRDQYDRLLALDPVANSRTQKMLARSKQAAIGALELRS